MADVREHATSTAPASAGAVRGHVGDSSLGVSGAEPAAPAVSVASIVAVVGGIAWMLLAGDSIVGGDARRYRDALFLVPWVLTALTYVAVWRRQRHRVGRPARWGFAVLMAGMAIMAAGQIHVVLTDAEQNVAFPAAPAMFAVGTLALGVSTVRTRALRRRAGVLIATSQLLTVALAVALAPWVPLSDYGNYSGAAMHGLMMLLVAEDLRAGR